MTKERKKREKRKKKIRPSGHNLDVTNSNIRKLSGQFPPDDFYRYPGKYRM